MISSVITLAGSLVNAVTVSNIASQYSVNQTLFYPDIGCQVNSLPGECKKNEKTNRISDTFRSPMCISVLIGIYSSISYTSIRQELSG